MKHQIYTKQFSEVIKLIILIGFIAHTQSCKSQSNLNNDENYKNKLDLILNRVENNDKIENEDILSVMPDTRGKALIFYSFDYDKSRNKSFQKLNNIIYNTALQGNNRVLSKYLVMSQFVDGYFAEAYFDQIKKLAIDQHDMFCIEYKKLNTEEVSRLENIYKSRCE